MMQTQSLASVGYIAGQLQTPVARILAIAASEGIRPAMTINGIVHFSDDDVERIAGYIARNRSAVQGENV